MSAPLRLAWVGLALGWAAMGRFDTAIILLAIIVFAENSP